MSPSLRRFIIGSFFALMLLGECGQDTPTPSPDMHDYCDRDPIPITCDQPIGPQQAQ